MNEYDEMGEQNQSQQNRHFGYWRFGQNSIDYWISRKWSMKMLTGFTYFRRGPSGRLLSNTKMKLRRCGLRGENLQHMKLLTWITANRHTSLFPEMKHTYCTYVTSLPCSAKKFKSTKI
jgi:hypothetical protein